MTSSTHLLLLLLVAIFVVAHAENNIYEIFVAPNGNDNYNGLSPQQPFRTMKRAQAYIRSLRMQVGGQFASSPIVTFAPGTYFVNETIQFSAGDSGDANYPVIYRTSLESPQVQATFSSCRPVTGKWDTVQGTKMIRTIVPSVLAGKEYFLELFVNQERRTRARSDILHYEYGLNNSITMFVFKQGDIKNWPDIYDANLIVYHSWTTSRHYIKEVFLHNNTVLVSNPSDRTFDAFPVQSQNRYFVENIYEALDSPGEWYLNRKTGELTYYPLDGETMDNIQVCYPVLQELIKFVGNWDENEFVQNIAFENIGFSYSTWYINRTEVADWQSAAWQTHATVYLRDARHITFSKCNVEHTGEYAIFMERGCSYNVIDNCLINDMGAGGVRIGERWNSKYLTVHNKVSNNVITHGGEVWMEGVGVFILKSSHNIVWNNQIMHLYYSGISVGWEWGYNESLAYNNTIAYNYIRDIGMRQLNDMGGIYTLGISNGTVLHHNVIERVHSFIIYDWGIYLDEGSSFIEVHDNIVRDTGSASFFHHYGEGNRVHNNIFMNSDARDGDIAYGLVEDHLGMYFYENKVYQTTNHASLVFSYFPGFVFPDKYQFDNNQYFICTKTPIQITMNDTLISYEQWQAFPFYQDKHSVVHHGGCDMLQETDLQKILLH